MEDQIKHIFIRHTNPPSNEILLEFQYYDYFYSFKRSLDEKLEALFKKIISKITTIKYRKCSKKIKNQPIIDTCDIKVLNDSLEEQSSTSLVINDLLSFTLHLQINEVIYKIYMNPPWILHCQLPKISMVGSPIYPILEAQNIINENLSFVWHVGKSKNSNNWTKVHEEKVFIPIRDYLNHFIKLEISSPLNVKCQNFTVVSSNPIQDCPQTKYQLALLLDKTNISIDEKAFRMCSYNILSNKYACTKQAQTVLFRHCDSKFLAQDYRQCLILNELVENLPDIILLQEVDQLFYLRSLYPILKSKSYEGIYQNKTKTSLEGQAIFWNINKFKFVKNISIPHISSVINDESVLLWNTIRSFLADNNYLNDRWFSLAHCMTGCVLEMKISNKKIILSNNHLFFHPKYEILRLFQVAVVLNHTEEIKHEFDDAACIIGGDFNASYEDESLNFIFENSNEFEYGDKSFTLKHNLTNLDSVFRGILEFTNLTPDYTGLLDHIIFETTKLKVKKAFDVPNKSDILEHVALPNKFHPSDHLPLFCDMEFL